MLSRRAFLRVGSTGLLGLSLTEMAFLQRLRAAPAPRAQSAVFIFLSGGPSQLDSFDPKPEAPAEYRGEFASVATRIAGIRFCEHVPQLAQRADKLTILRAVSHTVSVHEGGIRYVMTGDRVATARSPSLGSLASFEHKQRGCPYYVAIPRAPGSAGGILGAAYEPFNLLSDGGQWLTAGPDPNNPESQEKFQRRLRLLEDLDTRFVRAGMEDPGTRAHREVYEQSFAILRSKELRQATDLTRESAATRERYGGAAWGEYLLLARRMLEAGAHFLSINFPGWDTHSDGFASLKAQLPGLDQAVAALIDDLSDRGMLATTNVVMLGEFGRTPRINEAGGRDHWPRAMSVLWAGGGTQGGRIVGATDRHGAEPTDGVATPEDLAYTLLQQLGVDPESTTLLPGGRRTLLGGRRLTELF